MRFSPPVSVTRASRNGVCAPSSKESECPVPAKPMSEVGISRAAPRTVTRAGCASDALPMFRLFVSTSRAPSSASRSPPLRTVMPLMAATEPAPSTRTQLSGLTTVKLLPRVV